MKLCTTLLELRWSVNTWIAEAISNTCLEKGSNKVCSGRAKKWKRWLFQWYPLFHICNQWAYAIEIWNQPTCFFIHRLERSKLLILENQKITLRSLMMVELGRWLQLEEHLNIYLPFFGKPMLKMEETLDMWLITSLNLMSFLLVSFSSNYARWKMWQVLIKETM